MASMLKLPAPFPSAPKNSAKHELRYNRARDPDNFNIVLFAADYSAKKFIDRMIGEDQWDWATPTSILIKKGGDKDIRVRCDDLRRLMNYRYKGDEELWVLPEPYASRAANYATAEAEDMAGEDVTPMRQKPWLKGAPTPTARKTRSSPGPHVKRSREGLVTATALAAELGVSGRDVRGVLRGLGMPKPAGGWAWPQAEADKILAQLRVKLKK